MRLKKALAGWLDCRYAVQCVLYGIAVRWILSESVGKNEFQLRKLLALNALVRSSYGSEMASHKHEERFRSRMGVPTVGSNLNKYFSQN